MYNSDQGIASPKKVTVLGGEMLGGRGETQLGKDCWAGRVTILGGGEQEWEEVKCIIVQMWFKSPEEVLQEGGPLPGPESGLLSNIRK